MSHDQIIRKHLVKAGIKNLREFGYPDVSEDNIISDRVFRSFFKEMLVGSKGNRRDFDSTIDELLKEIEQFESKDSK